MKIKAADGQYLCLVGSAACIFVSSEDSVEMEWVWLLDSDKLE